MDGIVTRTGSSRRRRGRRLERRAWAQVAVAALVSVLAVFAAVPAAFAVDVAPTRVAYVIDVAQSTSLSGGDCGDANADGIEDTLLDCEIRGAIAFNDSVVPFAPMPAAVIGFAADATVQDVSPEPGLQAFTDVAADGDGNGWNDITDTVQSLTTTAGASDLDAALLALNGLASPDSTLRAALFSTSHGSVSTGPGSPLQAAADAGTVIDTFAIGTGTSGCGAGEPLREIADTTGGSCFEVTDAARLAEIVWWGANPDPDPPELPVSNDDCKNDGWKRFNGTAAFKNQGDCVSYVATRAQNPPAG